MSMHFKRLFASVVYGLCFLASAVNAAVVNATYNNAADIPITAPGYMAAGSTVIFNLNFPPAAGTVLTVVKTTGLDLIQGNFSNLAQGEVVNLTYAGNTYPFVANYYGGTGNDLVLQWADTKAYGWGNNASGQLGLNNKASVYIPSAVTASGVLAGKTIVSISAGFYFTLALCSDGTVATWGKNGSGQLGNNSTVDSTVPVDITGSGVLAGRTVIAISAGYEHSLALCSDGTVASWGNNGNGQLGNNTTASSSIPVAVSTTGVLSGRKVSAISAGAYFSLALCSDGKAVSWGTGGNGQLGNGTSGIEARVPINVTSTGVLLGKTVVAISAGSTHAIALCSDGSVVAWGSNNDGETGGASGNSPVFISPLGALAGKTVTAISAGNRHNLALCADGSIAAWGGGQIGGAPLGYGSNTPSSTPVGVVTNGVLSGKTVTAVAAGYLHSVALCSDGTLAAWGRNSSRELGNLLNSNSEFAPVQVLQTSLGARKCVALAAGHSAYHTLALAALPSSSGDSTLSSLALDSGSLTPAFSSKTTSFSACVPASTSSLTITPAASNAGASLTVNGNAVISGSASQAIPLAVGTNTVNVTVTALDGTTTTYGITILRPSPLNVTFTSVNTVPVSFPAYDATALTADLSLGFSPPNGTNLTLVRNTGLGFITGRFSNLAQGATVTLAYGGYNFAFVVDYFGGNGNDLVLRWANGKSYACGNNATGQLGNNSISNSNLPAAVLDSGALAGKTVTAIAAGKSHTLALCADGSVASWGDNATGQLGNGSGGANALSKVPVSVVTSGALAGKTVAAIAAGSGTSYALCSDGTVVSWGDNSYGQLGNGTISGYSKVPVTVLDAGLLADRPVAAIAAGGSFCLALGVDGRLASWGQNANGLLGNNSTTDSGSPVAVDTSGWLAGRTVAAISAGSVFSLALCSDGTLLSWGSNSSGMLGDNSTSSSRVPTSVNTLSALVGKTVTAISAGGSHSFAVCSDGTIVAWGNNDSGKFGNNSSTSSSVPVVVSPFGALSGKTVSSITAGYSHSLARCSDGTLAAWGNNYYGVMGNGGNTSSTTPVAVSTSSLGTGVKFASMAVGSMATHMVVTTAIPSQASLAGLTALSLGSGTLSPAFSSNIAAYTASVPNATSSITVTPTALNANVGLTVNGIPVISGTSSPEIPLAEGANTITIIATSPDGSTVKTHTVTVTRGIILNVRFTNAASVPVTASGYTAASSVANFSLGYAPATGATLTVINNTGPAFISGQFTNLAHLQTVSLTYGNVTYKFIANYYGGTGNDLVLMWASNRTYVWGDNYHTELGNNSTTNSAIPLAVATGPLAGKSIVRVAGGSSHSFALCSDGILAAWGEATMKLGISGLPTGRLPGATSLTGALAGKTIAAIGGGESHSVALCSDGTLAAWGSNESGQLGNDGPTGSTSDGSQVPVAVATNGALAGKTATAIALGSGHTLALCSDGTVVSWGIGNNGQLGTGSLEDATTPFAVTTTGALAGKTVVSIAAGVAHSLALCSDGTLVSWGYNPYGQLGNNSTTNSSVPVAINSFGALSGRTIVAIAAGGYHSFALRSDGVLVSWGHNDAGQLGNNSVTDSKIPVLVSATGVLAGKTIAGIAAGSSHSLVLCSDGTLAGWGENYAGQLANGSFNVGSRVPVTAATSGIPAGGKFMSLAGGCGASHAMAIVALPLQSAAPLPASAITGLSATLNGSVNAANNATTVSFEYGQTNAYGTAAASIPSSVTGTSDTAVHAAISGLIPGTTYHYRVIATSDGGIVRSPDMTFTTLSDNAKLASLGLGTGALAPVFGKLTTSYVATVPFTTSNITVTPVTDHAGAKLKVNGTSVVSGVASGLITLPVGNTTITTVVTAEDGVTTKTYTVTVTRLPASFSFKSATDVPVTANGFSAGGYQVTVSLGFAPAPGTILTMVKNDGLGFIVGRFGNLAQGQRVTLNFAGTNYDFVVNYFGGTGNDLVLQWADTELFAWGSNSYGQLGDSTTLQRLAPVPVVGSGVLSGKTITAAAGGYLHSLALCSDGTLAAWGYNVFGQLGNNGTAPSSLPMAVDQSGALAGKTVVAISAGPFHNLALCSDGSMAAWGYNNYGQLGTGDKVTGRIPVRVTPVGALADKQVVAVAAGSYSSFALCSDGTVAAWGYNDDGELGDGTTNTSLIPVSVTASGVLAGKQVASISAGQYHTLALCTDGTLCTWGYNNRGQLGNNGTVSNKAPVVIGSSGILAGKAITSISAGAFHSMVTCSDGTLAAWGSNSKGQLGVAGLAQSVIPIVVDLSSLPGINPAFRIGLGANHGILATSDGNLYGWGDNSSGQLGNNSSISTTLPMRWETSSFDPGMRLMSATSGCASQHAIAIIAGISSVSTSSLPPDLLAMGGTTATSSDSDQDGVSDLLEFAFGLNPNLADAEGLPVAVWAGGRMEIRFTQPAGVTGVIYGAEWNSSLDSGPWFEIPDSGTGFEHVFRMPTNVGDRCFMRLKVVRP